MRRVAGIVSIVFLLAGASLALSHGQSGIGPVPSVTGANGLGGLPAEPNCTACHFDDPERDPLNTPGGGIEILGVPRGYEAGGTYQITVRLHTDSTALDPDRKWGFQLTAVNAADGQGAGTFTVDVDTLQVIAGEDLFANRRYVEHTFFGTRTGLASPVTWSFSWQAPDPATGRVYFFAAGNAADGTEDPGLDYIFTTADSSDDITTPVLRTTWAGVKRRWR